MKISSDEVRRRFLEFFKARSHRDIGSASLVPINDPTLLLINSGMAPLKPYFTGQSIPPNPRLCNIQKCIRTNDIESVGDRHHLTFFEMMGNWAVGDYFKETAISLAWEVIHDVFGFDTSQLFATVYRGDKKFPQVPPDTESEQIWKRFISADHIIHLGADSNFWGPAGDTGPCGPCTEIFIDRGEQYGCHKPGCGPDCSCGRFLEIWNGGVFMQYYLHEDGTLTDLPLKSVDAGAGLERFCVILQGVDSVYETDLVSPVAANFISLGLRPDSRSVRIMTDHIRAAVFMISDGIYPANSKREYVLRRIIRRALLHASLAGLEQSVLFNAAGTVTKLLSPYYPELNESRARVDMILTQEATVFIRVLKQGTREFEKIAGRSERVVSGENAFRLHDALGFPLELTQELAQARGLSVDDMEFKNLLETQRQRSRKKTSK